MKKLAFVLALGLVFASAAMAANVSKFQPGTGQHNVLPSGRDVCWSEPPDLEGLIGSSEQILMYALETELANDFTISTDNTIGIARFWGGYWNNSVACASGMTYQGHNLRFYEDCGCIPCELPNQPPHYAEYLGINCDEGTMLYCQGAYYPIFDYQCCISVPVYGGYLYWFGAQMMDHPFPPQWGRLAAGMITSCDTVFWAPYFGYPEWTPAIDVFGMAFDASQEFECGAVPTTTTSWGAIKGLYR